MSVITTHAYVTIDRDSDLQNDKNFKPKHWMFDELSKTQHDSFVDYPSRYNDYFRSSRNDLIERRLGELISEQLVDGVDYIDNIISKKK